MSVCRSLCQTVCLLVGHVTLSLKPRKTAEFAENRCPLRERATNQGSGSSSHLLSSVNHSLNHSYASQGASLAYVGLVLKFKQEHSQKCQEPPKKRVSSTYPIFCWFLAFLTMFPLEYLKKKNSSFRHFLRGI